MDRHRLRNVGVFALVGWSPVPLSMQTVFSALLSILAAFSYGCGGVYAKKAFTGVSPLSLSIGQQLGAAFVLIPLTVFYIPTKPVSPVVVYSVLGLAVFCTAAAYLFYFYLLANVGPTKTLSVTFLVPVFGVIWGMIFLHEKITIGISAGAYLSPTFAAYIKSFFVRPDLDEGLQIAAKEGFSETTEASVTDNGITLKVKEVMADANRLILTYSLEKENGEFIDPTILFESEEWGPGRAIYFVKDLNTFYITDKDGDIVSTSTNYRTKKGRFVTQYINRVFPHYPYADLMFELNHSASDSKQLFANISINKIGSTHMDITEKNSNHKRHKACFFV
jgi:uncharacterized membrane protein